MPGSGYTKPGNWRTLKRQVIARDGGHCFCGAPAITADHIIPRARGGSDHPSNLRAICADCHDPKSKAEAADGRRAAIRRKMGAKTLPTEDHPGVISSNA